MNDPLEKHEPPKKQRFGGETMIMGEANERVSTLNGVRVQAYDGETGTVYNVYVNRKRRIAQVWVNMDTGGARCFRPHHLVTISPEIAENAFKRLEEGEGQG